MELAGPKEKFREKRHNLFKNHRYSEDLDNLLVDVVEKDDRGASKWHVQIRLK